MAKTREETIQQDLARQLDALRGLSDGWDSYCAVAPMADAIDRAQGLVDVLVRNGHAIAHIGP